MALRAWLAAMPIAFGPSGAPADGLMAEVYERKAALKFLPAIILSLMAWKCVERRVLLTMMELEDQTEMTEAEISEHLRTLETAGMIRRVSTDPPVYDVLPLA